MPTIAPNPPKIARLRPQIASFLPKSFYNSPESVKNPNLFMQNERNLPIPRIAPTPCPATTYAPLRLSPPEGIKANRTQPNPIQSQFAKTLKNAPNPLQHNSLRPPDLLPPESRRTQSNPIFIYPSPHLRLPTPYPNCQPQRPAPPLRNIRYPHARSSATTASLSGKLHTPHPLVPPGRQRRHSPAIYWNGEQYAENPIFLCKG